MISAISKYENVLRIFRKVSFSIILLYFSRPRKGRVSLTIKMKPILCDIRYGAV